MEDKQQSIDTNVNNLCTRCCQVEPKAEFGEYELHVYDEELKRTQQVMETYNSCARCREQKTNTKKRMQISSSIIKQHAKEINCNKKLITKQSKYVPDV